MSQNLFKIYDGKNNFWQWDKGQQLIVFDNSITEVHFSNKDMNHSITEKVYELNGQRVCNVPDILLQLPLNLIAYAYIEDGVYGTTKKSVKFAVVKRQIPVDYVIEPDEQLITLQREIEVAEQAIDVLEQKVGEDSVAQQISDAINDIGIEKYAKASDLEKEIKRATVSEEELGELIEDVSWGVEYTKLLINDLEIDVDALEQKVGDQSVVLQIADAIDKLNIEDCAKQNDLNKEINRATATEEKLNEAIQDVDTKVDGVKHLVGDESVDSQISGALTEFEDTLGSKVYVRGDAPNDAEDGDLWVDTSASTSIEDESLFVKYSPSDIQYEVVEGIKYYNGWREDPECFTVFIKISNKKFANIYATKRNAPVNNSGTMTQTILCDKDKQFIKTSGIISAAAPYIIFDYKDVLDTENACYYALSYVNSTEVEIKISGVGFVNENYLDLSKTIIPEDLIVNADNVITNITNICWATSVQRWHYFALDDRPGTNFFEVSNGDVFYHNSKYIFLLCFDENYNYVGSAGGSSSNKIVIELDDTIKYAQAWSSAAGMVNNELWLSRKDLSRSQYISNVKVNEQYIDVSNINKNEFKCWYKGKNASFIGDSLTQNGTGGYYITHLDNYFHFEKITNAGKGGTFISGETISMGDPFWYDSRVNFVDIDSDIIFIAGGTNDANNNVKVGDCDIANCDTSTFYGAYNVLISKLLYKFYKLESGYYSNIDYSGVTQVSEVKPVKIFLITPPYMLGSATQYNKISTYADAVVNVGKLLGLPVCDTRANAETNIMLASYYNKNGDYTHLNTDAHKQWANVIIGKMLEVEPVCNDL